MSLQQPGEGLQADWPTPIEMDQLFPVMFPLGPGGPTNRYVRADDKPWGRLTNHGGPSYDEVVGGDLVEVRKNRELLVGALCTYGHFQRFSAIDLRLAEMLKQVEQSEEELEEVGDKTLSEAFEFLQTGLTELQRAYRYERIPDLNRCISEDPSDIMVGLTPTENTDTLGRDKLSGLAVLGSVYYSPVVDVCDESLPFKSLIRPVLIGQDEAAGTLPEGQAVRALFVRMPD